MRYEDLKYLSVQLPEDILKEKWSGNFDLARRIIDKRLEKELPKALRCRLELERKNLDHLECCYTVSEEEALAEVQKEISDFTRTELEGLRLEGKIDWIYLKGKIMYLDSFCGTLFKSYPELWARTDAGDKSDYQILDDLIDGITAGQEISCHIHIKQTLELEPNAVEEGRILHVHMPIPHQRDGITNLNMISIEPQPQSISSDNSPQPTVYFEETAKKNQKFSLEYSLEHTVTYVDLSKIDIEEAAAVPLPQESLQYLVEELPHIQFSPYLKCLAMELKGEETNPVLMARRFYDFITTKTSYRFVRSYACIDHLSEYCALNMVGDCGVEALLFITLCRISHIPARWQSGIDAKPGDVGEHDWAQFYVPSVGWVSADLSYGGSAYLRGAMDRWNYFFGNIDPFRIPINTQFQKDFDPPKKFWRMDPYDNQCGEAEYDDHGVYEKDLNYKYIEIDIRRVK